MSPVAVEKFGVLGKKNETKYRCSAAFFKGMPLLGIGTFGHSLQIKFQFFPMRLLLLGVFNPAIRRVSIAYRLETSDMKFSLQILSDEKNTLS